MKIIITERHLGVISESKESGSVNSTIPLENQINELIDKKGKSDIIGQVEKSLLDNFYISIKDVSIDGKTMVVSIGSIDTKLNRVGGAYQIKFSSGEKMVIGKLPLTTIDGLEKLSEYKELEKRGVDVNELLSQSQIQVELVSGNGIVQFKTVKSVENSVDTKLAVSLGTKYPLGEFYKRNKLIISFKNGSYGVLQMNGVVIRVSGVKLPTIQPKKSDDKSINNPTSKQKSL